MSFIATTLSLIAGVLIGYKLTNSSKATPTSEQQS